MARFEHTPLADADPARLGRFDTVFAINVDLFWTQPAQHELGVVAQMLGSSGTLWIIYTPPRGRSLGPLTTAIGDRLDRAGYRHETITRSAGADGVVATRGQVTGDYDRDRAVRRLR